MSCPSLRDTPRVLQLGRVRATAQFRSIQTAKLYMTVRGNCRVPSLVRLHDAYAIARAESYPRSICVGLAYLRGLQCTRSSMTREIGGFGVSRLDRTQWIDVTGHAASAFLKSIANGLSRAD